MKPGINLGGIINVKTKTVYGKKSYLFSKTFRFQSVKSLIMKVTIHPAAAHYLVLEIGLYHLIKQSQKECTSRKLQNSYLQRAGN